MLTFARERGRFVRSEVARLQSLLAQHLVLRAQNTLPFCASKD